jgi:hypothetical protein
VLTSDGRNISSLTVSFQVNGNETAPNGLWKSNNFLYDKNRRLVSYGLVWGSAKIQSERSIGAVISTSSYQYSNGLLTEINTDEKGFPIALQYDTRKSGGPLVD